MHEAEPNVEASTQAPAHVFRRVLVPVNLDMASHRAVYIALELRRAFGSRVCVYNLTNQDENDQYLAGLGDRPTTRDLVERGDAALKRFVNNIVPGQADDLEYDVDVADDYVGGIRDKAAAWHATLIVLSHEVHPAILRTHTEKLLKQLCVPVFLA